MSQTKKIFHRHDINTPHNDADGQPYLAGQVNSQSDNLRDLLNALTSGVSALIAAIDLNYCYIYFSEAYAQEVKRLLGLDLQIGMTVMDVYRERPEQLAFSLKQWNRSLGGEYFKEVVRFLRAEADENYYEVTYSPIKDQNNAISGAVIVSKNITRRLDQEKSLTESEMRYQQLFDHVLEGMAICEFLNDQTGQPMDYRILDVNPYFTKIFGAGREQVVGSTYSTSTPLLKLLSLDRLQQVAFLGQSMHFEDYSIELDRTFEVFVYPLPKNCFAILLSDITVKKSEQDHRDWLASFPEQNPLPVFEVDYECNMTYQNPAGKKIFSELGGVAATKLFLEKIADVIDTHQKGKDPKPSMDVLIRSTWLHLSFYHMPKRHRIRIYSIDITERVNAENELIELNHKLEETVNIRTQELNRVNRELNLDILRRQDTEKALEAERKRFIDVLQVLPVYVILLTPQGQISFANKFFSVTFNYSSITDCCDFSLFRKNPDEVLNTFKPMESGLPNIWEWVSSENRIYTVHDYPFIDVDGSPLILEMGLDITDIRKAQEKLLETSNYNRSLIEANLDFLVTISQDGIIGDVNAAAVNATGLSREELVGTRFDGYFDDPEAAMRGVQLVLETGSVRNYELNLKHKDGHTTPVAYNASFYTNLDGNVVGIFAGARDLTDLKKKENQLLELNRALEAAIEHEAAIHDQLVQAEKFAAMGRMLASVTHEINNPLQTISNCLYLISSDIPPDSQASQFLTMATSETGRISKLVAELKDVYRPRQEGNYAPVNLPTLMDEIYQLIKPQLSQKRVEWDLANGDIATKEFWVNGISDQLKQVFINLSTNAIDAMQPDGGLLKVTLKKGKNHEVGVALSDTGPGIDPEYLSRIFEPFFSTKNQGLGLGLSICYDIIQRHQGHIEVSSISGKGSTFEVWLPGFDDVNAMKGKYGTTS